MSRAWHRLAIAWLGVITVAGCAAQPRATPDGVILFIPGVSGDGPWYGNLKRGLREGGATLPVESFSWGAPAPLFMLNFNNVAIHNAAEQKLADRLTAIRGSQPDAPIFILTHSAGGGVALGALRRAAGGVAVDRVVLLHPSVSPTYDLEPALGRINESLTVFHSDRDTTFLQWRTNTFGTYDNIRTTAAGNAGFSTTQLTAKAGAKLRHVPFDADFENSGNDGGHFGATARSFAAQHLAPLLRAP